MWFIYAIIFHIFLLGSIFVIYFRSPVISGLEPTLPIQLKAPAKRLVLFVTDGLRAQSFFYRNCANIPHIRQLIVDKGGIVGISHTRVPTETRPGHIALIAGFYEDPSAVTRGWKENPIEFDTIFKRSYKTYAWGAHDVLHIFNKWSQQDNSNVKQQLFFDAYDHELDFSGSERTLELDKWVFERVENFLQRKYALLQQEEKVFYFLHLLGLDSAGHIYKPQTELFLENLHYTDAGIYKMYMLFEKLFPDNGTTYLITSDHGMTNSGSHGAGELFETETPFFIWGAGINHTLANSHTFIKLNGNKAIPIHHVEQAQLCPLMTTLLGLPTPINNFGILPKHFLNVSDEYVAHGMVCNANQLLEQYIYLLKQHKAGRLSYFMPEYDALKWSIVNGLKLYIKQNLDAHDYDTVLNVAHSLMLTTLKGINYYQSYYCNILLVATTLAMLAWLNYLLNLLFQLQFKQQNYKKLKQLKLKDFRNILFLLIIVTLFCILQKLPLQISFYLLLPVFVMLLNRYSSSFSFSYNTVMSFSVSQILILLICIECLVFSFYKRELISVVFLLYMCWCLQPSLSISYPSLSLSLSCIITLILTLILSCFPLLPLTVGYTNNYFWILSIFVTYSRSFLIKCYIPFQDRVIGAVCILNALYCVYIHNKQHKLPFLCQTISWLYIIYVGYVLIRKWQNRKSYRNNRQLGQHAMANTKQNLEHVIYLFTILYTLLCTSYECLFILLLITQLILSLESMQTTVTTSTSGSSTILTLNYTTATTLNNFNNELPSSSILSSKLQLTQCTRLSFLIVLYMLFSFFGCGHMASISSFDPNIIRCFLTTFSPFIITFLIMLKLCIPTFLILCCVVALTQQFTIYADFYIEQLFICLLLICNIMDMNFLFLVRNEGSWLEIGMSISHFVIMQVATLVLVLFTYCAKAIVLDKYDGCENESDDVGEGEGEGEGECEGEVTRPLAQSSLKACVKPSFINIENTDNTKTQ